jgi:hypothetical protein
VPRQQIDVLLQRLGELVERLMELEELSPLHVPMCLFGLAV